ncbi:FAD/NAD(P)-binding domain-containing protein [Agrocybe pediades]|nr:FAD/NAD(P)-binding domain-containing protein [Agrocybe pediades]
MSKNQNIVIVGGGNGGLTAFNALYDVLDASKFNLTLITTRPFFTHLPGSLRMIATEEGKLEETVLMPYPTERFNKGNKKLVIGKVTSIVSSGEKGGHVSLETGEEVPFHVLILAPGSLWEGPLSFPNAQDEAVKTIKETRSRFANAKDIVLAGGGSIGIELAGELKDLGGGKNITIVHSQDLLLNDAYPRKWRQKATKSVTDRGVNVILEDYIDDLEIKDGKITTRKGKSITADIVMPTRGPRPNTKFLESLGSDVLASNGYINVLPTLQVKGHPNIFALGDAIEWKEQKQAGKVGNHAAVVLANVLAILGVSKKALVNYKGSNEMIVITNGKNGGIGYFNVLWGITLGNRMSSMIKSKSLFIAMTKDALKL